MLKLKVCRLRTSNLVGGFSMRYQLPWPAIKACEVGLLHARARSYRVGRIRRPHNLFRCKFVALNGN